MTNVIDLTNYFEQRVRNREKEIMTPRPGVDIPLELSLTAGVELQLQMLENLAFAGEYRSPAELRDFFTLRTLAASVFQNTLFSEHLWPAVSSATIKHYDKENQIDVFDEFLSVKFIDLPKLHTGGIRTPVFTIDLRICKDTKPIPSNRRVFPTDTHLTPPDLGDNAPNFQLVVQRVLELCEQHLGLCGYSEGRKVLFVMLPIDRPFGKYVMISMKFGE